MFKVIQFCGFLSMMIFASELFAQAPDKISYQSLIRGGNGLPLSNKKIGIRLSVLSGSISGTVVYSESHTPQSNVNGLISIELGGGTKLTGDFTKIDWSAGSFFVKTETDTTGGSNYTLVGTTQLLSVPYALYAKSTTLKVSASGDTLYSGNNYVVVPGVSYANNTGSGNTPTLATVTTSIGGSVTSSTATINGVVTSEGASAVVTRGICYGTSVLPTVSNTTVAAGSGLGGFSLSLSGLSAGTTYYVRTFATNSNGTSYGNQVSFTTTGNLDTACSIGSSLTVTHTIGNVAPESKTVTYKLFKTDLSGASKCWISQNLGADRQATSIDDNTMASSGWYWQFNRKQGYVHDDYNNRNPFYLWEAVNENSSWVTINDPCNLLLGAGWRIPTVSEWNSLLIKVKWQFTSSAFNSSFRLHYNGYLSGGGALIGRGLTGRYWSSSQETTESAYQVILIDPGAPYLDAGYISKRFGYAVRCLRD